MMHHKNDLEFVEEGMAVYDANGDHIGEVKLVRMSDENPNRPGAETVTAQKRETRNSLIDNLAEALVTDGQEDLPEDLRARLQQKGFIRIDQGMLKPDCFAMADDIAAVGEDKVTLNVMGEKLLNY